MSGGEKKLADKGCFVLPKNEPVLWDGKVASGSDAVIIVQEKKIVVRAAMLSDHKQQDIPAGCVARWRRCSAARSARTS